MNIEEFYDADERRRESQELELGSDWSDATGRRYDLGYVVATGELYLMAAPVAEVYEDTFGDTGVIPEQVDELSVEILGIVPTTDEMHTLLEGWQSAMSTRGSVEWLRSKLRNVATR